MKQKLEMKDSKFLIDEESLKFVIQIMVNWISKE